MTDAADPGNLPVRVLVVEDERVIALDIQLCLETLGYEVVAMVAAGEAAIEQARALRPDVVLMDIHLEGEMDGIEAARQIWEELQIPIIYITGYSDQATVDRATSTDLFGYILKPIKERDLYIAIKTALQRYEQENRLRVQETRLIEREQWIATILKAIGDGVIVTDVENRVKFLNLVAESLTGWTLEEAFDRPLLDLFTLIHEQTHLPIDNPVTETLRTGKTVYLVDPALLITKDGRQIPIADSAAPLKDDSGKVTGAVVVFRGIEERQLAQERALAVQRAQLLEQQMLELQQSNQLKDDFLNTVSHELRTPLTSIKMAIHMLEVSLERRTLNLDPEEQTISERTDRYLKILRSQCDQELRLVNDLLELQRLEAGYVRHEWSQINPSEWIPQVAEAYQERAQEQQIQLQINLADELPLLISDVEVLTHVLSELLTNACKYTPAGGLVQVEAVSADANLQLTVKNSGVELPPSELDRLFDKFYRVASQDYRKQGGTGLGLALVKQQISALEGTIRVENDNNEIRFVIDLPLRSTGISSWQ